MLKDAAGFPGYQLSDQGQVFGKRGKILKQFTASNGAGLYVNIAGTTRLVHVLMLSTFVGPSAERIHWLNGNRRDNRLSNLRYGEPTEPTSVARCSKGHELAGNNVATWGSSRICLACQRGEPAVRELPEIL